MKRIYLLAFLFCSKAFSQQNVSDHYLQQLDKTIREERLAHVNLMARTSSGGFANSSNNFDVHYYRCEWSVDPSINYINGKVSSVFTTTSDANSITYDLMHVLMVDSVVYHGNKVTFNQDSTTETIQVNFPSTIPANQIDSVSIFYQGAPAGSGFGSFNQTNHSGTPVIWTLSEPYGARDWWPCKNGLSDKADSIDVLLKYPSAYLGTSNGLLQSETSNGSITTSWYKHRYPIASYLVAFAVTNYIVLNDTVQVSNKSMPLIQYSYPEWLSDFVYNTPMLKRTIRLYTQYFGDYPFLKEKYGQTQFSWGGGMEHQTNSFVTSGAEGLAVHELAHQWFGDKITTGSWQHIWLNEGFAVFSSNFSFELNYDHASLISALTSQMNYVTSAPGGSVLVDDTTDVNRIFDGRLTYYKGGYLLRMLRWKLGDSVFFRGIRTYLSDPKLAYNFARTEDLQRNLETVSGQNLSEFFKDWFYGQGYPSYHLEWMPIGNGWIRTKLSQTTSDLSVSFFEMPVPITFKNATEEKTIVINQTTNGQISFSNLGFVPDTAMIDPEVWLISKANQADKIIDNSITAGAEIFPNPISDQFNIYIHGLQQPEAVLSIYNAIGQLVLRKTIPLLNGSSIEQIQSSAFPRGAYFVKISAGNNIKIVKKVLK